MTRLATLTVLSALKDDAAQVSARLDALGGTSAGAARSPFAASDRTHFARLLVVPARRSCQLRPRGMRLPARMLDLLTHLGRQQAQDQLPASYLLFTAAYDHQQGSPYPEHLRQSLGAGADDVWAGCECYPGWQDPTGFTAFLRRGTVRAGYEFTPVEQATVGEVRQALAVRRSVIAFATRTGSPDSQAAAALRREFSARSGAARRVKKPTGPAGDADETEDWNRRAGRDSESYLHRDPVRRPSTRLRPEDLQDVQGLTVGYGRHRAAGYLTARITDPVLARRWLAGVQVTSAAQAGARTPGEIGHVALNVAVSHSGLARLGVDEQDREGFDPSFRAGMAARADALDPGTGTSSWETDFVTGVDLMLHVSAVDGDTLSAALHRQAGELLDSGGFAVPVSHPGERIVVPQTGYEGFVEHFGFADGLSQPAIAGLPRGSDRSRRSDGDPLPPGELLLGFRDVDGGCAGDVAPQWLARNGSYLVFRKLEQDVAGFREMAGTSAAKLVGRTAAGLPLTPAEPAPEAAAGDPGFMSFAQDAEGFGCPVGAHARRVNPRDSMPLLTKDVARGSGSHDARLEQRLARRHRMLRRGIPYGPPLPPGVTEAEPPEGGRGLLFVALVGDIGRQFEFVQTQWMNDGNAFRLGSDADVFAGFAAPGTKVTVQGCPPDFVRVDRPVVTCLGGEYFLMPGIAALRRLAALS